MNKRYLIISIFFFVIALLCLITLLTAEFQSYALTGAIVCTVVAIAFLKRARNRYNR